jgi:hypothetical protein
MVHCAPLSFCVALAKQYEVYVQGSETIFNKECVPNPCCSTSASSGSGPAPKYSDFKRLCGKWQHSVVAAMRIALLSKEYMQTRNALLFLSYNSQVCSMHS